MELSKSIKSNKKISFRVLAQIASAVPKRVKFTKLDYNGTADTICANSLKLIFIRFYRFT